MKRAAVLLMLMLGCRKTDSDTAADNTSSKKPKLTRCVVEQKGKAYSIAPRCDVSWRTKFELTAGETLTIGAGSRVRFSEDAEIASMGGTIVARGSTEEPIVFTSSDKEFTIWIDEGLEPAIAPVSIFEHVDFDHGALRTRRSRARLSVADARFRASELAFSVNIDEELVSAKRLAFANNKIDVHAPAKTVSRIEQTVFAGPVRLSPTPVSDVVTLPKAPAYIVDLLTIEDGTLTFPEGSVVQMNSFGTITAAPGKKAELVAKKVHFTSTASTPRAGDWKGLELDGTTSKLDGCTIEYGGSVRFATDASRATIVNTTFRNNSGAGIEAPDCAPFEDATKANTAPGGTLCKVYAPSPDSFGYGGLGLTGVGPGAGMSEGIGLGAIGVIGGTKAGPTSKLVESGITVVGKLPPEVVKRIMRTSFARFRNCYDVARKTDPALKGTVSIKFIIATNGSVASAITTPGTLKAPSMAVCLSSAFRTLSFPEPESGIVSVALTHEYAPP